MSDLATLESRLDAVTLPLLLPLRASKTIDGVAMAELLQIGRDLVAVVSTLALVPRTLVGKSWFLFTQMLADADHARAPEPILDAAWRWQGFLRKAFGMSY